VKAILQIASLLVLGLSALAGWDFYGFIQRAEQSLTRTDPDPDARAVVALTGASDARIIEAVTLSGRLNLPLLISGVHADTRPEDIARIAGVAQERVECCVTLGKAATTTEGNGQEVARWARLRNIDRIMVVTSEYHMDRALLELRRAMPEASFIPHAVSSMKVAPGLWYSDPVTARRMVEEWVKFRIAAVRARQTRPPAADPGQRQAMT
jgi:uncharacterized SAM-binding protein YcdF (DUF218 family)